MKKKSFARSQAAFSLVEVALALGVAAFCMVPIFGLVPIGVNTNLASFEQSGAASVASAVAADMEAVDLRQFLQASQPSTLSTTLYSIPVPKTPAGSSGNFTTFYVRADGTPSGGLNQNLDATQSPHYRVTLYFTPTNTIGTSPVGNPNATAARILVTWPATADGTATKAPTAFAGSFESFAGLVVNN